MQQAQVKKTQGNSVLLSLTLDMSFPIDNQEISQSAL